MNIKPNAGQDEFSSPYFIINKTFCEDFENYILSKNGEVKGVYNAWSYTVYGKIENPKKWVLKYKKATFSNSGNLLLSSKKQSLLVLSTWKTKRINISSADFLIRKNRILDFLNKSKKLNVSKKYVLISEHKKSLLVQRLIDITKELFEKEEIYEIELKNGILKIELRTENHYFNIFEELIEI